MSKPGILYRVQWAAFHESEDIQCIIDIGDMANLIEDDDEAAVYDLVPSGVPAELSIIDNNEDPHSVICAKQLVIRFRNTQNYNLNTFATGEDQRWYVNYYMDDGAGGNSRTVFKGYLVMDDLSEPLLPYGAEEVTLTATDNIGLLKDIPLTDFDGNTPVGKYRISEFLAMALSKTGLSLESRVSFNIKLDGDITDIQTENAVDEHLFSRVYLDAKTFEDETDEYLNCYDVIKRILGYEAKLFQMKGQWWILRIDEVEDTNIRPLYVTSFDSVGTFTLNIGGALFVKYIDKDDSIKFSQDSTIVRVSRPRKSVRLNYNYETPKEIPYNHRFEHGDLFNTVSATQKQYYLDGWKLIQNISTPTVPACSMYIERTFDANGYEDERYMVLTSPVTPSALNFAMSPPIRVHGNDRFNFSVDFRLASNISGSGSIYTQSVAAIRLVGDDGNYYILDNNGVWFTSNSTWSVNFKYIEYQFVPNDEDETEYVTVSVESKDIPSTGTLYFDLYALNQQGGAMDDVAIHFTNFSFDYLPYINGNYREYDGHYFKTSQSGDYKAKVEDDVYLADSPKELFKGAMFLTDSESTVFSGSVAFAAGTSFAISGFHVHKFEKGQILRISDTTSNNMTTRVVSVSYSIILSSTLVVVEDATVSETDATTNIYTPVFELCDGFYNAAVFPTGPPDSTYIHPYGEIQLYDVWNQYRSEMRVIEATLQGLDLNLLDADNLPDHADLINKWNMTDNSAHLVNRFFQLLSYQQNHDLQEWTGTFREVFNSSDPKNYTGLEFKYIEK